MMQRTKYKIIMQSGREEVVDNFCMDNRNTNRIKNVSYINPTYGSHRISAGDRFKSRDII